MAACLSVIPATFGIGIFHGGLSGSEAQIPDKPGWRLMQCGEYYQSQQAKGGS